MRRNIFRWMRGGIGNGSVEALVDPLNDKQRLRWQTFQDAFEDFGGVEDLLAQSTVCRVQRNLRSDRDLSILSGILALL